MSAVEPPSLDTQADVLTACDEEDWLDVFSLNRVPPKRAYTMRARFHYAGRGKPRRYDFGDLFDDVEEEKENL